VSVLYRIDIFGTRAGAQWSSEGVGKGADRSGG
jgi:hypothetical protein